MRTARATACNGARCCPSLAMACREMLYEAPRQPDHLRRPWHVRRTAPRADTSRPVGVPDRELGGGASRADRSRQARGRRLPDACAAHRERVSRPLRGCTTWRKERPLSTTPPSSPRHRRTRTSPAPSRPAREIRRQRRSPATGTMSPGTSPPPGSWPPRRRPATLAPCQQARSHQRSRDWARAVRARRVGEGVAVVLAAAGSSLGDADGLSSEGSAAADGSDASLASARFTASCVRSGPEAPVMPWPSSETASKLPAVAVAAPSSHAATPKRMRLFTSQHLSRILKPR